MKLWEIFGYALLLFFCFYLISNLRNIKEGLTSGVGGTASTFNDELKAKLVLLQDELLISKYRTDYEDILMNMETYLNLMILKKTVNLNPETSDDVITINNLYNLINSVGSSIKFIDSQ